jgi:tetratricopeptide (TPR) repeat protein
MGGALLHESDPVALVLIAVAVVSAATVVGVAVYRQRKRFPRWLRSVMVRRRLDMIRRDLYRVSEYVGMPDQSEQADWQHFEHGLMAMAMCQWNQAIASFQKVQAHGDETQLALLLNQIGVCHYMQGRLGDALREFEESARLAGQHENGQCRASALCNIGIIRHDRGELDRALKDLREALAMARESANQAAVALYLGNIGNVLREKGELNQALKSHEDALAISRRIGDDQGVASGLGNIGSVLRDKGDRDKALDRYAEAEEMARKIDYKLGAVVQLSNIGNLYREKGELDRAQKSHESALAMAHEIGYRVGVATELVNIGLILVAKRMHDRALSYLAESLTFFWAEGVADGQRQGLYGLSKCDDSLGRGRMQELLKQAGLTEEGVANTLDRIDHIRSRRPWQKDRRLNPFGPVRQ